MIPKTIHYCWFGPHPLSANSQRCIASWHANLRGYTFKCWDETNIPLRFAYLRNAQQNRMWSNMSNFVRLYALFCEGGIYLDTDVELIGGFDELQAFPAFLGCESTDPRLNNAVSGAERGHPCWFEALAALQARFDGTEPSNESGPPLITGILNQHGLREYSEQPQHIADVAILPKRYFYPCYFGEQFVPSCITPDTVCIHHWEKRW